jgi:hypothetical protein
MPKKSTKRVSNPQGYFLFDADKLIELKGHRSHAEFAKLLGVSVGTAKRLVDPANFGYVSVQAETAQKISTALGKSIQELICRRDLPSEPEVYESITRGWFIENSQDKVNEDRTPLWHSERNSLKHDGDASRVAGRLCLSGQIENCCENKFTIRAELWAADIFCLLGIGENKRLSFVGIVNRYIDYRERGLKMFMGTWTGFDVAGYTAVFRWILTNIDLSRDDLKTITNDFHIQAYFEATDFHEGFSKYALNV